MAQSFATGTWETFIGWGRRTTACASALLCFTASTPIRGLLFGVSALALTACASKSTPPPETAYDSEEFVPAVVEPDPPTPVEAVTQSEPLPLAGQMKPTPNGEAATPEKRPPPAHVDAANKAQRPGEEWTLQELVAEALDQNAGLAATRSASDAAREGIDAARGARLPRVDAVGLGEYFPRRERLLIFRHGFRRDDNPFQTAIVNYGLEVTLPLYTSGRIEHGIGLAEARADAARFRIDVTRHELIFNVASTYFTALRLQDVIAAQEAALASLRESLRVAELQREVGRIAPLDLLRIETRVSQAERDLVGARTTYDRAIEILKELMAVPPEVVIDVAGKLIPASLLGERAESLRQQALDNRPDLVALRHDVQAQREALGIADARFGPTVDLKAGYRGVTGVDDGTTRDDAAIFLQLRFPLYSGGVLEAQRRQDAAELRRVEFRLQDAERRALGEVNRAMLDLKAAAPRIEAARRVVEQAEESLRVERQKFAQGRGTSNDLLLAEEALLRARTQLAAALTDSQLSRAELNLAIGKDPVPVPASSALPSGASQ